MADASFSQDPAPADLAAQEAARVALLQEQRISALRAKPVDAGMLNVPFIGNRALRELEDDPEALEPARNPAGAVEEAGREHGWRAGWRQAFSAGQKDARNLFSAPSAEPQGLDGQLKQQAGAALIRMCWATLWWPSFGHSVYVLILVFTAGAASSYVRQYVPEVGKEWFPPAIAARLPRSAILPLKLGEITAMAVILFLVALLDLAIFACIVFVVGLVMTVS